MALSANFCSRCGTACAAKLEPAPTPTLPALAPSDNTAEPVHRPTPANDVIATPTAFSPSSHFNVAERRQLTVLFCDLVGSTKLSVRLDPEDLRAVLATYRNACAEVVSDCGGTVYEHLGDGIVVIFGYPHAHEESAQRAVHAGLQITQMFSGISSPLAPYDENLTVRIGINTGLVVIGDDGAGAAGKELSVIGEVPNLAARLQELAEPGSVVISEFTERLLKRQFALNDLGANLFKGFSQPIRCAQVVGPTLLDGPSTLPSTSVQAPLIGRDGELMLLQQQWRNALEGDGQVMLLCGEAGVGKSRLFDEFTDSVASPDIHLVRFHCSSFYSHSVLRPVVGELRSRFGIKAGQDDAYETLRQALPSALLEHLPALAALLGLTPDGAGSVESFTPDELKRRTTMAILAFYSALAAEKPLLMQFEDVHWCDPTTLETIEQFINNLGVQPWLLVLTYRPDYTPPLHSLSYVTSLTLNRFSNSDIRRLVTLLVGGCALPSNLTEQIVERADGIPLFAEELTRMVLESGWIKEVEGGWEVAPGHIELAIPNSLQDSLMARLDRLPSAKEVAQLAATIGRRFSLALLSRVTRQNDTQLQAVLTQLVDAELIYGRDTKPFSVYEFKHALVQDAAYHSLLRTDRQSTHQQIATALEAYFPEVRSQEPELVARHFALGGDHDNAHVYHLEAGNRALASSASREAVNHLENALTSLRQMPASPERDEIEFDTLVKLAVPQAAALGYAHERVNYSYERALELAKSRDDKSAIFPVTYGLVRYHLLGGRYAESLEYAAQLADISSAAKSAVVQAALDRSIGAAQFYQGQPEQSLHHLAQVEASELDDGQRAEALNYDVVDLKVAALSYTSLSAWQQGRLVKAECALSAAINEARDRNHPFSHALALAFGSWLHGFSGNIDQARKLAEDTLVLSQQYTFEFWTGWAEVMIAWSSAKQSGDYASGIASAESGIKNWMATRSRLGLTYFQFLVADLHFCAGDWDTAESTVWEAEAVARENSEHFWTPELTRLKGDIAWARSSSHAPEAIAFYETACAQADEFGAISLKKRALTSLLAVQEASGAEPTAARALAQHNEQNKDTSDTDTVTQEREVL